MTDHALRHKNFDGLMVALAIAQLSENGFWSIVTRCVVINPLDIAYSIPPLSSKAGTSADPLKFVDCWAPSPLIALLF